MSESHSRHDTIRTIPFRTGSSLSRTAVAALIALVGGCQLPARTPEATRSPLSGSASSAVSMERLPRAEIQASNDAAPPHPVHFAQFVDARSDLEEAVTGDEQPGTESKSRPPSVIHAAPHVPEDLPRGTVEATGVESLPINLETALQRAGGQNPRVAFAAERIEEAMAQLRAAEVLWVPSLRAGANYNKHEGRIQDVEGNIIETSRGSIYAGLGAQAVGAGSPAVPGLLLNVHLRDAMFQPQIGERVVEARHAASLAATNDTLLDTALAYIDLLEAHQIKAVADETLGNAERLAELTASFARAGQGLPADADRAQAELSMRRIDVRRAAENARVAAVRLNRLLSQDASLELAPQESAITPIDLVTDNSPIHELVAIGLANRPELAESGFLVDEAVLRLRRERLAPLVPSVLLGLSYGGNGGGLGGDIERFGDRLDLDAAAFWEVRNLGFGERAARDTAHARVHQAMWQQVQVMDQVAAEVAEAHAQSSSRKLEIELAKNSIRYATDSYQRNSDRIHDGQGLPIETMQSIQALDQARRQYVRSVADYNRAQFRLHRALGWPIAGP